jgi:hypothetical protein
MEDLISRIKRFLSLKIVIIYAVCVILPLLQLTYWSFEAGYFGFFGISPELLNRPLFSSLFINIWVFAILLKPAFIVWTSIMVVVFISLIISFNYNPPKQLKSNLYERIGQDKLKHIFYKLTASVLLSANLTLIIWAVVFIAFLAPLFAITKASNEGADLARKQIKLYQQANFECFDGFQENNLGCFSIEGIDGSDYLVITNNRSHLVYFSRQWSKSVKSTGTVRLVRLELHILEKAPGKTYKITRQYKPRFG